MLAAAFAAASLIIDCPWAQADPNALWQIVDGQCVPDQQRHADPAPCALVDPGYVVLKDLVGPTQFLLIPTARVAGIESPALLDPDSPNYFAAAWRARTFVEQRAGQPLPRDWASLALNSAPGRTQDQFHIHIDCVRAEVRNALLRHITEIGSRWAPFPEPLAGAPYQAVAVDGDDLYADPIRLLADGVDGARTDMADRTLVVVGRYGADGRPGFVILAGRADPAIGDPGSGEDLQDHDACPPSAGTWAK
jgi:CDP-diacylglycerol pyrophosphatase